MNKRMDLLDKLKLYALSGKGKLDLREKSYKLLVNIQSYYKYKDLDTGSMHHEIFTLLYLTRKNYSYDDVALESNISIRTLDRYRQAYNAFATKLILYINDFNSIGQILADRIG